MAMGDTEYAGAIGAPFAITVIGGLAFSTLLTLLIIPTVYMGLENALKWYRTLSVKYKITHLLVFVFGVVFIYFQEADLLYQALYITLLAFLIPGVTFCTNQFTKC